MMNRIFFEGRDPGISSHLWPGGFSHSVDAPNDFDGTERDADSGLWIVRDRPMVHPLSGGATAFVPEYYEANYAYPLLVWFTAGNTASSDFEKLMTDVSPRNCLGLKIVLDPASGNRRVVETVRDSIGEFRRSWHVHTERIIPAGAGASGETALRAFLARPAWFGGAIALETHFTEVPILPLRTPALRDKRILLTSSNESPAVDESQRSLARMLNAAGMTVTRHHYHEPTLDQTPALADVNKWVMEAICVPV